MEPQIELTETAAVSTPPATTTRQKMTHEQRLEKKRAYMAAKYQDPQFREAKKLDMVTRYHARNPEARHGIRGRRPRAIAPTAPEAPEAQIATTSDDILSAASTPRHNTD
jgi:hypothetical protein